MKKLPNYDTWKLMNPYKGRDLPDVSDDLCPDCLEIGKYEFKETESDDDQEIAIYECKGTDQEFVCGNILEKLI